VRRRPHPIRVKRGITFGIGSVFAGSGVYFACQERSTAFQDPVTRIQIKLHVLSRRSLGTREWAYELKMQSRPHQVAKKIQTMLNALSFET